MKVFPQVHVSSLNIKVENKPAPSLAISSRSAEVLAEAMASGSFRVKGNTSLREAEDRSSEEERKRLTKTSESGWDLKPFIPNV